MVSLPYLSLKGFHEPPAGCGTLRWGTHRMCSQTYEKLPLEQKEATRNMETAKTKKKIGVLLLADGSLFSDK